MNNDDEDKRDREDRAARLLQRALWRNRCPVREMGKKKVDGSNLRATGQPRELAGAEVR